MKRIVRRLFVVLYVLWGILYMFIVLFARQLAAPMMANPTFVSEMILALFGTLIILVLVTILTFAILRVAEQHSENKKDSLLETSKTASIPELSKSFRTQAK